MAYEIRSDDPMAWPWPAGGGAMFFLPKPLLAAAVEGPPIKRTRIYAIAECTICGDPYERHGEFDPAEVNRMPRCRCCKQTTTVPVRLTTRMVTAEIGEET